MRPPLLINGAPAPDRPRHRPSRPQAVGPRPRIFDHFTGGEPEGARFSRIARALRASPFWTSESEWSEPQPVAGEIEAP